MSSSFNMLWKAPYNRQHRLRAVGRWLIWKGIRLLRIRNMPYPLWGNRKIFLHYDSFQSMWIMYNYWVDWEEFNLILDYVQPGDQVADVGTNMGFYTIWFSKFIGDSGHIHCFEPDEMNFKKLEANCRLNQLKNVCLNNIAVGNQTGTVSFTSGLDGENHIATVDDNQTKQVNIIRFDEYCQQKQIEK